MSIFLRLHTNGWYVETIGKICLFDFVFCCTADCLLLKLTSASVFCIIFSGYPCDTRRDLKFEVLSSNAALEEFVLRSLRASPLIKPAFTSGGWLEVKWVN